MLKTLPPAALSRELREGRSPDLTRRRWAIGLSYAGGVIGMIVGAYQTGIFKRLPDILPGEVWDCVHSGTSLPSLPTELDSVR